MRCFLFLAICLGFSFSVFSQSDQLARNFFDQGEYEKALQIYQELYEKNPANMTFFEGMVGALQQLEEFDQAEKLLFQRLNNSANNPSILIELGHNFELQNNAERAKQFYEEALKSLAGRPNYAYSIARSFERYNLLDYAASAYEQAMEMNTDKNYNLQLARIYGEQGKIEKMFSNYLDLIEDDMKFYSIANREFNRYISEDASSEGNTIFRKLLLKRSQENPSLLYNEMLSWLFIQQKDFGKAFAQERAIYKRGEKNLQGILNLAVMAKNAEDYEAAEEIIAYAIEESPSPTFNLRGRHFQLGLKEKTVSGKELEKLEQEYRSLLEEYGYTSETLDIQVDLANFMAFRLDKKQEAVALLKNLSKSNLNEFEQAKVKMATADILVMQEKFNEALIFYSQVQHLVKNNELSQEARFKVAKTSYFKGDFEWAQTQLKVLKSSTSQLIANDALELSLLISDNSIEDSTQAALKQYARADLLAFQEKPTQAITVLDSVLTGHKGEKIEDEALYKQAKLFEKEQDFEKAAGNYHKIIELHGKDILADNANYFLAELYANQLNQPEKAKEFYEQIIFNFADSIYFVDARKKFRILRGDNLE
ncbi:tetratricopeptide repeat protein [Christiangramia flava]|uniref:Secreted protein containing tetratricopeptide re peats n=1 Tax=Christiangramia flava JLT2011 TaxID=1229726 RepID=A0A1L7I598_9FLAO|nr:tetratricopeptide repeat protein [Christiangramia flava]APU68394.1 Secreted protein containing tetratricopeptide re peats [Christiangramia flava JLT2011]OSS40818.1 Secreted protein [Christiangramia flava JLT2011]